MTLLLTKEDVAEIGNWSVRTVIRMRDNGTLPPPLKVGRLIRWRKSDIEKWIEGGCVPQYKTRRH